MKENKEQWSSWIGFVAAASASAVGLGNIWRFPYIAGSNGGGAFLIAYILSLLLVGIPLLIVELAAGRGYGLGIYGTFQAINRKARWIGLAIAILSVVIVSYYLVITGWAAGYFISSLSGSAVNLATFTAGFNSIIYFFLVLAISVGILFLGVRGGIERVSLRVMPLLFLIVLALAVYAAFLQGWENALAFYLTPDFNALANPTVWLAALGQTFFSVGVGFGVMLTFGSYLGSNVSIPRSALAIVGFDTIIALLAGLAIFPVVFTVGMQPAEGPQLAFNVLPQILSDIPLGWLAGPVFYLGLTMAAITSAISIMEVSVAVLMDSIGLSRARSILAVIPVIFVLGLVSALSYSPVALNLLGLPFLDMVDQAAGNFGLTLSVLVTAVIVGWLMPAQRLISEITGDSHRLGAVMLFLVRYVAPLTTLAVLVLSFAWK